MHLVALFGSGPSAHALARYRDAAGRFHLHAVPDGREGEALGALAAVGAAGALLHGDGLQRKARSAVERASLDADELQAVDTITVTAGGTVGDYLGGRALGALLGASGWHAREARAVVVGTGALAAAALRELASQGAAELTLLGVSAPEAEQALPTLPAGAAARGRAAHDPAVPALLERADLVVRMNGDVAVPEGALGPHLTLVDLAGEALSPVRRRAVDLGAVTFNRADLEAHRAAIALRQILGGEVEVEPLLDRLHSG